MCFRFDERRCAQLTALDAAARPQDLAAIPDWRLHEMEGNQAGRWSITVNGNWRLTFIFEGTDIVLLDYEDYHQERQHESDAHMTCGRPRRSSVEKSDLSFNARALLPDGQTVADRHFAEGLPQKSLSRHG